MAWQAVDRKPPVASKSQEPLLDAATREKIRSFFPRYATKRAVLLPALHVVQDFLGYVPFGAMIEVAELLEIHPSDVLDTISFYTHFWTKPKGRKAIVACRSISCELMGAREVLAAVKEHLGIGEHETTPDGEFSLATEECLAGCDHGPCLLINERLHKQVKPDDVKGILDDPENDRLPFERSPLFDAPVRAVESGGSRSGGAAGGDGNGSAGSAGSTA